LTVKFVLLGTLRDYSGDGEVEARGRALREALESLEDTHPELKDNICDEHGRVRELITVFVGGKEMRNLSGEDTRLREDDGVFVMPSVAGGAVQRLL
jgi:molybdopterin converting factor small subunit